MKKSLLFLILFLPLSGIAQQWTKVDAGSEYTLALKSDGTLWAWGFNGNGQLGLGSTVAQSSPTQIGTATDWQDVAAGSFHALAVKTDGTLWSWGLNGQGQLGLGTMTQETSPTQVGTATNWKSVEAGFIHSFAIKTDNSLWSWGWNMFGQLGLGITSDINTPTQVGTDTDWQSVTAGGVHSAAIKTSGTLWAWGSNGNGQLGNGTTNDATSPQQIGNLSNWEMVSAGFEYCLALQDDKSVWSWGFNGNSQLGDDGLGAQQTSPVNFDVSKDWKAVEAGASFGFAIKDDGRLFGWGSNLQGQLGTGSTSQEDNPVQVGMETDWDFISAADGALVNNSLFGQHTLGLKIARNAMCGTGANYQGQVGNGTTSALSTFSCSIGILNVGLLFNSLEKVIEIFPNPSSGFISIQSQESLTNYTLTIFSLSGKKVRELPIEHQNNIDLSDITSGVYLLTIEGSHGEVKRQKLILD